MANRVRFSTIPDEVLHIAEAAHSYLSSRGFKISIEKQAIDYPRTPSLLAKLGHTVLFVEVSAKIDKGVASEWVRYCRSCNTDVQFAFAIPNDPGASQVDMEFCTGNKVGLLTFDTGGAGVELVAPVDLALHVELPELADLPPKVRAAVAPAYKKFERGDWRDGLADACLVTEDRARKYLKSRISKPGVRILDIKTGRPIPLTARQVEKATLGALGNYFLGVSTPNAIDSLLGKTLPTINPERIGTVHKRHSLRAEKKLRMMVGQRMYAILNCLRSLLV